MNKNEELPKSEQLILKEELLAGTLSPFDFINRLDALDQSTPGRENAIPNLPILEDPEVMAMFENSEHASCYWNLLSLTYFHIGQREASSDGEKALAYFEKALDALLKTEFAEEEGPYLEATIAYFRKDVSRLRDLLPKIPQTPFRRNYEIVENMIEGLQRRGTIDYNEDYNK